LVHTTTDSLHEPVYYYEIGLMNYNMTKPKRERTAVMVLASEEDSN